MKPIKFSKKLRLNKKTIVDLTKSEMVTANGGADVDETYTVGCHTRTLCQTECPSNGSLPYHICCNLC